MRTFAIITSVPANLGSLLLLRVGQVCQVCVSSTGLIVAVDVVHCSRRVEKAKGAGDGVPSEPEGWARGDPFVVCELAVSHVCEFGCSIAVVGFGICLVFLLWKRRWKWEGEREGSDTW